MTRSLCLGLSLDIELELIQDAGVTHLASHGPRFFVLLKKDTLQKYSVDGSRSVSLNILAGMRTMEDASCG